jgi:hypothetical protein
MHFPLEFFFNSNKNFCEKNTFSKQMENFCNEFGLEHVDNLSLLETYLEARTNVFLDTRAMSETNYVDLLCIVESYKKRIIITDSDSAIVFDKYPSTFNIYKFASIIFDTYIKNDSDLLKENMKPKKSFFDCFGCNILFMFDAHDLSSLHWKFIHNIMDSTILICIIQDSSQSMYN